MVAHGWGRQPSNPWLLEQCPSGPRGLAVMGIPAVRWRRLIRTQECIDVALVRKISAFCQNTDPHCCTQTPLALRPAPKLRTVCAARRPPGYARIRASTSLPGREGRTPRERRPPNQGGPDPEATTPSGRPKRCGCRPLHGARAATHRGRCTRDGGPNVKPASVPCAQPNSWPGPIRGAHHLIRGLGLLDDPRLRLGSWGATGGTHSRWPMRLGVSGGSAL